MAKLPNVKPSDGDTLTASEVVVRPFFVWLLLLFLVFEYLRPQVFEGLRFQLSMIIIFLFALIFAKDRPRSTILYTQILFLAVAAAGVFWANYPNVISVLKPLAGYVVIAYAFTWLMNTPQSFRRIVKFWVIISTLCGIYGLTHGGNGPGGYLGDENDLALACLVALPVPLFALRGAAEWPKWLCFTLIGILLAAIAATLSRGGFIGLATILLYYIGSSDKRFRVIAGVIALLAILLALNPTYVDEIISIRTDVTEELNVDSTSLNRYYLWNSAARMWADNPVAGIGLGNFGLYADDYKPMDGDWPSHFFRRSWWGKQTHSIYFQILAELGTLGFLLFLFIVFKSFSVLKRSRITDASGTHLSLQGNQDPDLSMYARALTASLLAFLAAGAFLSVAYYPHFWIITAMVAALETLVPTVK